MTTPGDNPGLARQLSQVPLFQGLATDELRRIRDLAQSKTIGAAECLFNEREDAEGFVVLTSDA